MPIRSRFWRILSTVFVQTLSYMTQLRVYIIRRQQYAMVTVVNTCNNSNRLKYDPQPGKKTPKISISINTYLLAACRDVKLSQSMVKLHSVMSIYNVETMLASRVIFNNGNTHNGLIFDPKGWSEPPKQVCLHWLTACRDVKLSQSMVELHSVMSIYNVETMLGSCFIFNNDKTRNGRLIFDPKGGCSEPLKPAR